MRSEDWQGIRLVIAVVAGAVTLLAGVKQGDPAMMTIGAGLVGFSPAANGPQHQPQQKLVIP